MHICVLFNILLISGFRVLFLLPGMEMILGCVNLHHFRSNTETHMLKQELPKCPCYYQEPYYWPTHISDKPTETILREGIESLSLSLPSIKREFLYLRPSFMSQFDKLFP